MRALPSLVALLVLPVVAAAQDPREVQNALVVRAQSADDDCRPAEALPLWRAAAAAAPGTRLARTATLRVADIEVRSTTGAAAGEPAGMSSDALAPLARLCAMRRDARHCTRVTILDYAHELDDVPPGLVRREGRAVVAETLVALGAQSDAERAWEALAREPGASAGDRRRAAEGIAATRAERGDLAGAVTTMDAAGLARSGATQRWQRERGRRIGRVIAWSLLLVFTLIGGALALRKRRWRSVVGPWRLALAVWVLGVPLVLAANYDGETLDTFSTFAVGGALLLLLASLAGAALREAPRSRRALVALLAASSVLAAGYLALDRAGVLLDLGL